MLTNHVRPAEPSAGDPPSDLEPHTRRLELYVRALWALDLAISPAGAQDGAAWPAPSLQDDVLSLGTLIPADSPSPELLYRAAAAHAAAHRAYGSPSFEAKALNLRQQLMISLVEDARVEALAVHELPGLGRLWRRCHGPADEASDLPGLMVRMSRALLWAVSGVHSEIQDSHPLVQKAVACFLDLQPRWRDPGISRDLGLALANDLGQMRLSAHSREWPRVAPYRDDNRHLFDSSKELEAPDANQPAGVDTDTRGGARLEEADLGIQLRLADADAPTGEDRGLRLRQSGAPAALRFRRDQSEHQESGVETLYPEWHHRMARYRADWCRVNDAPYPHSLPAKALLARHRQTLRQLRRQIDTWRLRAWHIARAQQDGDELDLDAVVRAVIRRRMGDEPDPRVYHRRVNGEGHGPTVLVLLDLSVSLARPVTTAGTPLFELARDAALLLAETLHLAGHRFAIHGFQSDTRHRVNYRRFKDFDRPHDALSRGRLAALQVAGSTRLGAALRHAGDRLAGLGAEHPLLLVISDGEPSDIDVHDPEHLTHDAREAVRDQRARGLAVHCLNLEPRDDARAAWIFGAHHVSGVRTLSQLPRRLPELYLSLVRQA